jgi:hypothetical protein
MNESCEIPEVADVYENGVLVLPRQSGLRFSLPMIYAGVGIALGILTGTSLALSGMPGSSSLALFSNSAPTGTSESSAQVAVVSAPAAAAAYVPVAYMQPAAAAVSSPAIDRALVIHPVHHASTAKHTHPSQIFPATRILLTSPVVPAAPAEREGARPAAHPVVKPARRLLASTAPVLQEPMAVAPNLDGAAQTSTFFTEGDLMVVAFDASNGTIESADGRTFAVGQTVSLGNTQSWDEYRSDVHYRCAANGNCTLMRPGVIATDARAI